MKRFIAVIAAAVAVIGLAACGENSDHKHYAATYKHGHDTYVRTYDPAQDALLWYILSPSSSPSSSTATWRQVSVPPTAIISTGRAVPVEENGKPGEPDEAISTDEISEEDLTNEDTTEQEAQTEEATESQNADDSSDQGSDSSDQGSDSSDQGSDSSDSGGGDSGF